MGRLWCLETLLLGEEWIFKFGTVLEEELEKFVPLFVRNEDFPQRPDHISDILLEDGNWLLYEPLEQEGFSLLLVFLCKVHPQVAYDLAQVDAGHLPQVLIRTCGH